MRYKDSPLLSAKLRTAAKALKDFDLNRGASTSGSIFETFDHLRDICVEVTKAISCAPDSSCSGSVRSLWWRQWSEGQTSQLFLECFDRALSCVPSLTLSSPEESVAVATALFAANLMIRSAPALSDHDTIEPGPWPQMESWLLQQGMAKNFAFFALFLRRIVLGTTSWSDCTLFLESLRPSLAFSSSSISRLRGISLSVCMDDIVELYCITLNRIIPHVRKWLEADSSTRPCMTDASQPPGKWLSYLECLLRSFLDPSLSTANWRPLTPLLVQSFQLAKDVHAEALPSDPACARQIFSLGLSLPLMILGPLLLEGGASIQVWPCICALQAMQIAVLPESILLSPPSTTLEATASTASAPPSLSALSSILWIEAEHVLLSISPELLKPPQLWDLMSLMEETLRLAATHPSAHAPHMISLWNAVYEACQALRDVGAGLSGCRAGPHSSCLPEQLCSSLLKMVSMGLTQAKSVALLPFKLGDEFSQYGHVRFLHCCGIYLMVLQHWVLPLPMRAWHGVAALIVPACCSLLAKVLPACILELGIAAEHANSTTASASSSAASVSSPAPVCTAAVPVSRITATASGTAAPVSSAADVVDVAESLVPSLLAGVRERGVAVYVACAAFENIRSLLSGITAPQLCLSLLLADPVWISIDAASKVLHQHWLACQQFLRAPRPRGGQSMSKAATRYARDMALEITACMALLVDSLACTALGVQPFRSSRQHQHSASPSFGSTSSLSRIWGDVTSECSALLSFGPAGDVYSPTRFRHMAAEMRRHPGEKASAGPAPSIASESGLSGVEGSSSAKVLAALSKVLASEVWEVLLEGTPNTFHVAMTVSTCFHELLIVLKQLLHCASLDALFAEAGALVHDLTCRLLPSLVSAIEGESKKSMPLRGVRVMGVQRGWRSQPRRNQSAAPPHGPVIGSVAEECTRIIQNAGLALLGLLRRILLLGQEAMPLEGGGSASAALTLSVMPSVGGSGAAEGSSWEMVCAQLLLDLPEELWGTRPCCSPACLQMGGSCEMTVKTLACGGGCGARYCCQACQVQAWNGGHMKNCAAMKEMRDRWQAGR